MQAQDRKEIEGQIDEIKKLIEDEVRISLTPDKWYVYMELRNEVEQLVIILKRNGVLCD